LTANNIRKTHNNQASQCCPKPRLIVGLPALTLAKRPAEAKQFDDLCFAIRALAREAARIDHRTLKDDK